MSVKCYTSLEGIFMWFSCETTMHDEYDLNPNSSDAHAFNPYNLNDDVDTLYNDCFDPDVNFLKDYEIITMKKNLTNSLRVF